jgi:hypothetical protein
MIKLLLMTVAVYPAVAHNTEESAALFQAATDEHWGADCSKLMEVISVYDFDRHFQIARSTGYMMDMLLAHACLEGLTVEKTGNAQHCIECNDRRYRAAESYIRAAPPPGACELNFYICSRSSFVGVEAHHQHLQPRRDFLQCFKYLGINHTQEVEDAFRSSAELVYIRGLSRSSTDGLHHLFPEHGFVALTCALMTFLVGTCEVELSWLDDLPRADATTLHCTSTYLQLPTARVLVAEVFEKQGRHADAIRFAQADLQDYHNVNVLAKVRAGRVLGRCHAALGQHMMAVSAFDAAIDLAHSRKLLLSEALSVRGRAAVGRNGAGGSGLHWDEETGRQRLAEVMGRMQGPREVLERVLVLPE